MRILTLTTFLIVWLRAASALNLTANRCQLTKMVTIEPQDRSPTILTTKNTGFVRTLIRDLDILSELSHPPGSIQDGFYCSQIGDHHEYGNLISPTEADQLKPGLVYALDILFIRTIKMNSEFCLWHGAVLGIEKCKATLLKYAEVLNLPEPGLPQPGDVSKYQIFNNQNDFNSFPLLILPGKLLQFNPTEEICGYDVYFSSVTELTAQFEELIEENIILLYTFIRPLMTQQVPRKKIYINDSELVATFNSFSHVPAIFKSTVTQHSPQFEFPILEYSPSASGIPTTLPWRVYLKLIEIVNKQGSLKNRRDLLGAFFGPDPSIQELQRHSQIQGKAFQIIKSNALRMIENQKQLQIGLNRVTVQESELTSITKQQAHRVHQLALNQGLLSFILSRKADRLSQIERLENLYNLAHVQLVDIKTQIETLSITQKHKCHVSPPNQNLDFSLLCSDHYPSFRAINEEVYIMYNSIRHHLVTEYALTCLPFGEHIFSFSGSNVIIRDDRVITESGDEFPRACLHNVRLCKDKYASSNTHLNRIANCSYINDDTFVMVNCVTPTQIDTAEGHTLTADDNPVTLPLSSFPITLSGQTLQASEVLQIIGSDLQAPHRRPEDDYYDPDINDPISSPQSPQDSPKTTIFNDSFKEFITPSGIHISHVFAGFSGLFCILFVVTVCCICCRNPRIARGCVEATTLATPSSGCQVLKLCCPPNMFPPTAPRPEPDQDRVSIPLLPAPTMTLQQSTSAPTGLAALAAQVPHPIYPDLQAAALPGFPAAQAAESVETRSTAPPVHAPPALNAHSARGAGPYTVTTTSHQNQPPTLTYTAGTIIQYT